MRSYMRISDNLTSNISKHNSRIRVQAPREY